MNVSIIGATGYSGIELIRLLNNHPHFKIASVHSSSKAGQYMHEENPQLLHLNMKLQPIDPASIKKISSIVFLATPSGISRELTPKLVAAGLKVIDLSGDLRLKEPQKYIDWYQKEPAPSEILDRAVYGLSEWNSENIKRADVVANPGCYPTATLLGLGPMVKQKWCKKNSIIVDAKSGISGAGRSALPGNMHSENNENFKIYKVHKHQHIPEIEQQLDLWVGDKVIIEFSTHLAPMTRGIMATIYAEIMEDITTEQLIDLYKKSYENHPFVRIQPQGKYPCTKQVQGSNYCDIGISVNDRTRRVTIVSVIDNLVKGAAGQAVQNANLMSGFEETAGLLLVPQFP